LSYRPMLAASPGSRFYMARELGLVRWSGPNGGQATRPVTILAQIVLGVN
jgi:hypothetical protein